MLITSHFISYQSNSVAIFIIRYLNTIISICCWTNFHFGEKAKAMRLQLPTIILFTIYLSFIKCREMTVSFQQTRQ